MANGSTAHGNVKEVRNHSLSLEVSPSKSSQSSPIAHGGHSATSKSARRHEHTSQLKHGTTRPKPKGTKVRGSKTDMMNQKSHGR